MKSKATVFARITAAMASTAVLIGLLCIFHSQFFELLTDAVLLFAKSYLPSKSVISLNSSVTDSSSGQVTDVFMPTEALAEATTPDEQQAEAQQKEDAVTEENQTAKPKLTDTDSDIKKLIAEAEKKAAKDKKDGDISDYKYVNDGVTDSYGKVKVKNTNKTDIDIKTYLGKKLDLDINKNEPAVLIYHTHTTETYQLLDRDFYPTGNVTRTNDDGRNMVRVGKAMCERLENAGYKVIHVTDIHDNPYSGAYSRSRKTVEEYLKKYPSIQITLDIHRDAIQRSDGTKIAPTAEINGKKAAQIMIISGCQEDGNGITNLPDWKENLTFALKLQKELEEGFPGITRPLYFCARSYNMNLTHCSLLVEVGSDANTLEEAVYTGKCLGETLVKILKEYEK